MSKRKYKYTGNSSFESAYYDCKLVDESIVDDQSFQDSDTGLVLYYMDRILDALKKQIPQKIFHQGYEYEGQMIYPVGINGVLYDLCPNCKTNLCTDGFLGRDKKRMKYCENCGQKLDWSE